MKKQLFTLVLLLALAITGAHAQLKIGDNPLVIDPDAILHMEVTAQNKGVLLPRVTTATRPAADATNAGMIVYNTTTGTTQYCNGTVWQELGAGGNLWTASGNDIYNTNTGNVGIGTTTPASKLEVGGTLTLTFQSATIFSNGVNVRKRGTTGNADAAIAANSELGYYSYFGWDGNAYTRGAFQIVNATQNWTPTAHGTSYSIFTTPNGTTGEVSRLFIGQDGRVGLSTTTPSGRLHVFTSENNNYAAYIQNTANATNTGGLFIQAGNSAGGSIAGHILFSRGGDGVSIGSILQNTVSTVAYNTSSDRRLKENFRPSAHGLSTILKLNVLDYNYIGDKTLSTGLIAQEAYEVVPSVVHQGSDDVKKDPWSIDYGKLTPYLIKAVQEQQAEIEALKAENAALKAQTAKVDQLAGELASIKALLQKPATTEKTETTTEKK